MGPPEQLRQQTGPRTGRRPSLAIALAVNHTPGVDWGDCFGTRKARN